MSSRILCISDDGGTDRELRLAVRSTAPNCAVEFVSCRDQIKAVRKPNLILLDLMLNREPAFDILRWLRDDPEYRDIPVFVLGSDPVDDEVSEAYGLGANSCLLKGKGSEEFGPIALAIATYASLMA